MPRLALTGRGQHSQRESPCHRLRPGTRWELPSAPSLDSHLGEREGTLCLVEATDHKGPGEHGRRPLGRGLRRGVPALMGVGRGGHWETDATMQTTCDTEAGIRCPCV